MVVIQSEEVSWILGYLMEIKDSYVLGVGLSYFQSEGFFIFDLIVLIQVS